MWYAEVKVTVLKRGLFLNVMHKSVAQVPLRREAVACVTWLCATRSSLVTTSCNIWRLLSRFVFFLYMYIYIYIYIYIYTRIISYTEELDKQLIDWETSLKTEEVPPFHLALHKIASYPTGRVFFSCFLSVPCTVTHTVNQQIIIYAFSSIMAGMSSFVFTLEQPRSDFL